MKNYTRRMVALVLIAVLICFALPVQSIGADSLIPPQAFWGKLSYTDGSPAAAGVVVSASVNGKNAGSLKTTKTGEYGNQYKGSAKLIVQGNLTEGDIVNFYVNGIPAITLSPDTGAEINVRFESNQVTQIDLVYAPPAPTTTTTTTTTHNGGGGGGGYTRTLTSTPTSTSTTSSLPVENPPASSTTSANINVDLDGNTSVLDISKSGIVQQSLIINSPDKTIELKILSGTKIISSSGILTNISVEAVNNPPSPPSNYNFITQAYDCQPAEISFDPPVNLIFHYNLPSGVDPSVLKAGCYSNGFWKILDPGEYTIDPAKSIVEIQIPHFSYYAVFVPTSPSEISTASSSQTTPARVSQSNLILWVVFIAVVLVLVVIIIWLARKKTKVK